jgi:hypothetical protein
MPDHLEGPLPLDTLSSWSRGDLQKKLHLAPASEIRDIWNSLIRSLTTPTLSEKQITSTCNCLRIFLKNTSSADILEVKNLPLVREEWRSCYEAICYIWNRAKVKPLVQVLELLLQIAKDGMPEDEIDSIWRDISSELSAIILSGQPARDLKRALALSSFFLEKGLPYGMYLESVQRNTRRLEIGALNGHGSDADTQTRLIHAVISSFHQHDAQSSAEKCFKTLLRASGKDASDSKTWWVVLKQLVADHADSLDPIANSVFPILLEQHAQGGLAMIDSQGTPENKEELLFSLALLQSLRERELLSQDGGSSH